MLFCTSLSLAQAQSATKPQQPTQTARPSQPSTTQTQSAPATLSLSDYGVSIQPDMRLIIVMAALDAAGFDPTPGKPSAFRAQVRRDEAGLNEDLRRRLRDFYERNKLPAKDGRTPTPAEQAARYISLAYALSGAPGLQSPPRTDDLPAGLLEVLDFAPLVREFYRKSGIDDHMGEYLRIYKDQGERLRAPAAEMVRNVLSYLHTRPITIAVDRVPVNNPSTKNKKDAKPAYTVRERERRFFIVPELLSPPGAINFRVIADDYYAVVPPGINPASSELRKAYLQYVLDPLVVRFGRDISARRPQIKQLLEERGKAGGSVSPDIFLTVARSIVVAADVRLQEKTRADAISQQMRADLERAKDKSTRDENVKRAQEALSAAADESIAQLAEAYEQGAVLDFYFAEQLKGIESSGFDVANFFTDMVNSFDPARESKRLTENTEVRNRALKARASRPARESAAATEPEIESGPRAALIKKLVEVDEMVQLRKYAESESRLLELLREYPGEARIFFALGEVASRSAQGVTDENLQAQRLNRALTHYDNAIHAANPDTDRALIMRARIARGRILEFFDRTDEALKEFEAAAQLCSVDGGACEEAKAGIARLKKP